MTGLQKPFQTGCLRAIVNADEDIVGYENTCGPEALITDISYWARGKPEMNSAADIRRWIEQRMPSATIGRYHSSRFAAVPSELKLENFNQGDDKTRGRIPFEHYVPADKFSESELLPHEFDHHEHPGGLRTVDFRQPAVRAKLIALVVDDALKMGASALMTDEWVPSANWVNSAWINPVLEYEAALTAALHARGILHFPNMHFRVGGDFDGTDEARLPPDALSALAKNCDALLLELPCDKNANPDKILADYKIISDKGTPCVLMNDDPQMLVGIAALTAINDFGIANYVAAPFWQLEPLWKWLPAKLGRPVRFGMSWKGNVCSRKFAGGVVSVDFDKRTCEIK